ncbi:xylose isomerase [Neobacillus cucumis]|nr:xylose isomerase [Neobacillus cucumis]
MAYFQSINKIQYEGPGSKNPLAYKYYNPQENNNGKTMEELLRFSVAYWHTFTAEGADPFGVGTAIRPWANLTGIDLAKARAEASFEFYEKLDVPFFCFHDVDIAPEGHPLFLRLKVRRHRILKFVIKTNFLYFSHKFI